MTPELELYLERLQDVRAEMWKTVEGLSADALNWTPLPKDTNSLFVLATHSLGAEHGWIGETIGHELKTRVRAAEFHAQGSGIDELRNTYEATARESEHVLAKLDEAALNETRERPKESVTVRWIILHVIEHYAEHLGQMRLTRQLWESRMETLKNA